MLTKGILINTTDKDGNEINTFAPSTHAVVYIGKIVDTPAVIENMEVIKEATYLEGYHVDIMTDENIEFSNEIKPNNPIHVFA
jgi:hypothetical protein